MTFKKKLQNQTMRWEGDLNLAIKHNFLQNSMEVKCILLGFWLQYSSLFIFHLRLNESQISNHYSWRLSAPESQRFDWTFPNFVAWNRPNSKSLETYLSSRPRFAAVESLDARVISRFPCNIHINTFAIVVTIHFYSNFYRTQVYLGSDLWVQVSLSK